MIDLVLTIEPDSFKGEVEREFENLIAEMLGEVAEDAPDHMRSLMGSKPPSKRGEPPARRTNTLYDSIKGDAKALEIEMAGHAFYLDPIFKGETSGGYLNRPFITEGVDRAVRNLSDLI